MAEDRTSRGPTGIVWCRVSSFRFSRRGQRLASANEVTARLVYRAAEDISPQSTVSKRLFDIVMAVIALLLFAIPMALLAVGIYISLGAPILFAQRRPGAFGRPFVMYKFRSMRQPTEGSTSDADRLTRFGRWLRATSLDELPELWNVLRGEMSLVGPRPLLPEYLPLYSPRQARRHEVRPGITGWAQVNGRNALSWEARFELDVWYVEHRTMWLDIKILALTVGAVLARRGISAAGEATMPKFTGSSESRGEIG